MGSNMRRGRPSSCRQRDVLMERQQIDWASQNSQYCLRRSQASLWSSILIAATFLATFLSPVHAVFLPNSSWTNCLASSIQHSAPQLQLQWVPEGVWTTFNSSGPQYNFNMTVYGNVTGQTHDTPLPPPGSPNWTDVNFTYGKIPDKNNATGLESTLFTTFNVLSWTPYSGPGTEFCNSVINNQNPVCPVAPFFPGNASYNVTSFPAFSIEHDLGSGYGFTTIHAYLHFVDDSTPPLSVGCITADVTPFLGSSISNLLTFIPLALLILVGIATASAAIFSPWGTWDIFRWTSNYGRDADQLRLITPGFGDCLQYIQFVVLSGSLSLDYPGFYQPAVSSVSWSSLMFNQSFVNQNSSADGHGPVGLIDGIYITNATYGLESMSQLVGYANDRNIWTGMMIWLLVIIAAVVALVQIGFAGRWVYRLVSGTREEDLRAKNFPFSAGNAIRIVFSYFMLPLVSLSMYQLVISSTVISENSSIVPVIFAVITLLLLLAFLVWLFRLITRANPRSYLFDDLSTVLIYGPLYNTYSDNAAAFALIPVTLTFVRGIAIGAVQPSGIVQLVLLAICEVILILTLNAFRPFSSPTSMNAYHTIFSAVRLTTILLMVPFVPSLSVDQSPRGWIGYVILLLHGITLLIGFFLHSLQTLVEVIARLLGAGDDQGAATRGGLVKVFGVRQLSRRNPRSAGRSRNSMASDAAMLNADVDNKRTSGGRSRSISASSHLLLSRGPVSDRQSIALESAGGGGHSHTGSGGPPYTPNTPSGPQPSSFSYLPESEQGGRSRTSGIVNIKSAEPTDPYFRAPRPRKTTLEMQSPSSRSHGSWTSGDWANITGPEGESPEPLEGSGGRVTPLPAHLGNRRERSDSNPNETGRPKPDYATREVDYYYHGYRGPALSHTPTRRLKTGPADPTGPVSSATGWFKNFFGGKTKESGKGFEVVRSSRVPQLRAAEEEDIALQEQEPYRDDPEAAGIPRTQGRPRNLELDDEGDAVGGGTRRVPSERPSPFSSDDEGPIRDDEPVSDDDLGVRSHRVSRSPPILDIDTGDSFQMPSRYGSKASSRPSRQHTQKGKEPLPVPVPAVPRKSSKRNTSYGNDGDFGLPDSRLSTIPSSPLQTPKRGSVAPDWPLTSSPAGASQRLPFGGLDPNTNRNHSRNPSGGSLMSGLSGLSGSSTQENSNVTPRPQPAFREERPSSVGFVQQHRASDNIHVVDPAEAAMSGSTAELVDDGSGRTPSPDKLSHG